MELDQLRVEIDRLDQELLSLFLQRMEVAEQIACYKREHGMAVLHPAREEAVLTRAEEMAGEEMAPYARMFFTEVMAISRKRQHALLDPEK